MYRRPDLSLTTRYLSPYIILVATRFSWLRQLRDQAASKSPLSVTAELLYRNWQSKYWLKEKQISLLSAGRCGLIPNGLTRPGKVGPMRFDPVSDRVLVVPVLR